MMDDYRFYLEPEETERKDDSTKIAAIAAGALVGGGILAGGAAYATNPEMFISHENLDSTFTPDLSHTSPAPETTPDDQHVEVHETHIHHHHYHPAPVETDPMQDAVDALNNISEANPEPWPGVAPIGPDPIIPQPGPEPWPGPEPEPWPGPEAIGPDPWSGPDDPDPWDPNISDPDPYDPDPDPYDPDPYDPDPFNPFPADPYGHYDPDIDSV